MARTSNEASLDIEDVCAAMIERGGCNGKHEELTNIVKQFFTEAAYQLCDGFSINTGFFTVYPNVGGIFESVKEAYDRKKHPIDFRFHINMALRKLIQHITVEIEGLAGTSGYIDGFTDVEADPGNGLVIPGHQFILSGYRIKIAGDDPNVGIFFVPVDNPEKAVKVERLAENSCNKIIGIIPKTKYKQYRIEIRSQYSGSSKILLKTVRVLTSSFIVETA